MTHFPAVPYINRANSLCRAIADIDADRNHRTRLGGHEITDTSPGDGSIVSALTRPKRNPPFLDAVPFSLATRCCRANHGWSPDYKASVRSFGSRPGNTP
jgi:hypothetical protein